MLTSMSDSVVLLVIVFFFCTFGNIIKFFNYNQRAHIIFSDNLSIKSCVCKCNIIIRYKALIDDKTMSISVYICIYIGNSGSERDYCSENEFHSDINI